jgi:hypothetical protein
MRMLILHGSSLVDLRATLEVGRSVEFPFRERRHGCHVPALGAVAASGVPIDAREEEDLHTAEEQAVNPSSRDAALRQSSLTTSAGRLHDSSSHREPFA